MNKKEESEKKLKKTIEDGTSDIIQPDVAPLNDENKTGPAEIENMAFDGCSALTKKVQPRCPMPARKPRQPKPEYKRKPINTNGIRLDKLSFGTLRRYQYFFGLDKQPGRPFIDNHE